MLCSTLPEKSRTQSDCCGGGGNLNFHIQNNNAAPLQTITLNSWKLVTAVRQSTTSTMYYDPASATSHTGDTLTGGVTNASCTTSSGTCITLGNAIDGRAESMGGYLAEIRAFTSALDVTTPWRRTWSVTMEASHHLSACRRARAATA